MWSRCLQKPCNTLPPLRAVEHLPATDPVPSRIPEIPRPCTRTCDTFAAVALCLLGRKAICRLLLPLYIVFIDHQALSERCLASDSQIAPHQDSYPHTLLLTGRSTCLVLLA